MKRKFKLITTVTSMLLALSLMVFGVYAIVQEAELTISNNIQFEVEDNKVDIVYEGPAYHLIDSNKDINSSSEVNNSSITFGSDNLFTLNSKTYIGYVIEIKSTLGADNFGAGVTHTFSAITAGTETELYLVDSAAASVNVETASVAANNLSNGTTIVQATEGEKIFSVLVLIPIDTTAPVPTQQVGFTVTATRS